MNTSEGSVRTEPREEDSVGKSSSATKEEEGSRAVSSVFTPSSAVPSAVDTSKEEEGTSGCGVGSGVVAGEPSAMPSAASVQ